MGLGDIEAPGDMQVARRRKKVTRVPPEYYKQKSNTIRNKLE